MMKKIFSFLLLSLLVQSVWSQSGEGYAPENPGDPDLYYTLTLEAAPLSSGTVSPNSRQKLSAGQSIYISASPRLGYEFKHWMMGDSLVSTERSYYFTMPKHNAVLTAYFEWNPEYDPQNPGDPDAEGYSHHVYVYASPSAGGYFNSSSFTLIEGKTANIYAYPREGYRFESWMVGGEVVSTDNPLQIRMGTADIAYTATFAYNPVSPGEPSPNVFNAATGEVIIDNFTPGSLNNAIYAAVGSSDNYDAVQSITVIGRMQSSDFGFARSYKNCSLIDLSRTTGYTEVPSWSFEGAEALKELNLPMNVERIGKNAFNGCVALTDIYLYATTPPTLDENALHGLGKNVSLHVPSASVALYAAAEGWNQLTVVSLNQNEKSITVSLPGEPGTYKDMTLELQNVQSGQVYRCLVTDRSSYTFFGLMKNTYYNIYIKNTNGVVLGEINNVALENENLSVSFNNIRSTQNVKLSIVTPNNEDVTADVAIIWLDEQGNYLRQGNTVNDLLTGTKIQYRVKLSKQLAMEYVQPEEITYEVKHADNNVVMTLAPIKQISMNGCVKDAATGQGIMGATVSISQVLNGKYPKTVIVKTDSKGIFTGTVYNAPTTIAISAYDYVNQTAEVSIDPSAETVTVNDIAMTSIIGATINVNLTYTPSVAEGETAVTQNWYDDYQNVAYSIYNLTTGKEVTQVSVRYPQLVVLDGAKVGDRLKLTARSKKDAFMPVEVEATVDEENRARITFPIVQKGQIAAGIAGMPVAGSHAMIYNEKGYLAGNHNCSSEQLSIEELDDGKYSLIIMENNGYISTIYSLSQIEQIGLVQNVDYIRADIEIVSGIIKNIQMPEIPHFDDNRFRFIDRKKNHTGVNKNTVVAGNYITIGGNINFIQDNVSEMNNPAVVFDVPEEATFVEKSVIVNGKISNYTYVGNRLSIPIADVTIENAIKFCIIPTTKGDYSPTMLVSYKIEEKDYILPIGGLHYTVENATIELSDVVITPSVYVRGYSLNNSLVQIYDGDMLIGSTTAKSGMWEVQCNLNNTYNLSVHPIHALITTPEGAVYETQTVKCTYDKNAVVPISVTMVTPYGQKIIFDYQNMRANYSGYSVQSGGFTFIADFNRNDTLHISAANIFVQTENGVSNCLKAKYDSHLDKWVASNNYSSNNLPVNVSVEYISAVNYDEEVESELIEDCNNIINIMQSEKDKEFNLIANLYELSSKTDDENLYKQYQDSIAKIQGITIEDIQKEDSITNVIISHLSEYENDDDFFFYVTTQVIKSITGEEISDKEAEDPDGYIKEIIYACPEMPLNSNNVDIVLPTYRYLRNNPALEIEQEFMPNSGWQIGGEIGEFTQHYSFNNVATGNDIHVDFNNALTDPSNSTEAMRQFEEEIAQLANSVRTDVYDLGINRIDKFFSDQTAKFYREERLYRKIADKIMHQGKPVSAQRIVRLNRAANEANKAMRTANKVAISAKGIDAFRKGLGIGGTLLTLGSDIGDGWTGCKEWDKLIEDANSLCNENDANRISKKAEDYKERFARRYGWKTAGSFVIDAGIMAGTAGSTVTFGATLAITAFGIASRGVMNHWKNCYTNDDKNRKNEIRNAIRQSRLIHKCDDDKDEQHDSPFKRLNISRDPSGYVYEGVSSNRLQGVTATAYYMETTEDMYGVLHDEPRVWDAEEYAQENPLFTDENGMYQWDVPQGLWQVKFEKEGYETTYSEWLPVPPPQLEVNIGMVQSRQPEVKQAHAYKDGIEVEFDKYMLPALLNTENILVSQNGTYIEGEVRMLNEETAYQDENVKYASKVRFVPATPFTASEVTLTVANRVKSYAGLQMQDAYQQTFDIEQELTAIKADSAVSVAYDGTLTLTVQVLPAEASAGKALRVHTSSPMIASIERETAQLDKDGKASVVVLGELPGAAVLTYSIDGYDLTAQTVVNVSIASITVCATPTASVASGSVVEKGTAITLSCETEGATIYYTLDGSCPCNETDACKVYDGTPIVINESVTIKAMAVAPNMTESDVAEFVYIVGGNTGIDDMTGNEQLQIYPLPVRDKVNICAGDKIINNVTISSLNGAVMASSNNSGTSVTIDVSRIPIGIYIVNVKSTDNIFSRKILKVE